MPFRLRQLFPVARDGSAGQPVKLFAQSFRATVEERRDFIPQLAKRLIGQRSEGRPGKIGAGRFFHLVVDRVRNQFNKPDLISDTQRYVLVFYRARRQSGSLQQRLDVNALSPAMRVRKAQKQAAAAPQCADLFQGGFPVKAGDREPRSRRV